MNSPLICVCCGAPLDNLYQCSYCHVRYKIPPNLSVTNQVVAPRIMYSSTDGAAEEFDRLITLIPDYKLFLYGPNRR